MSSRDNTSESVRSASRRPSIRCSTPSSTAASLIGFSKTAGCSTFSASAYLPTATKARPRSTAAVESVANPARSVCTSS